MGLHPADRTVILMGRLLRPGEVHSRCVDDVAASDDHLVHGSGNAVLWRELSLLYCSLNEQVLPLLVGYGQVGELVVKREAVPVRVSLELAVRAAVPVALPQPGIRNPGTRRQVTQFRFSGEVSREFDSVFLQIVIRTIRWPIWPGYGSTTARPADGSKPSKPG
jgi:hypothetical protein